MKVIRFNRPPTSWTTYCTNIVAFNYKYMKIYVVYFVQEGRYICISSNMSNMRYCTPSAELLRVEEFLLM